MDSGYWATNDFSGKTFYVGELPTITTSQDSALLLVSAKRPKIGDLPSGYVYDEYGFLKQVSHQVFEYTEEYKKRQGTNVAMSFLRLGWLSAHFSYERLRDMFVVDVGCGNGEFMKRAENLFFHICGYDIVGDSITKHELMNTHWDMVVLSDVLEHFEDIDELFRMKWEYCMLSFPETPVVGTFKELQSWRHFKPNEHIYHLYADGIVEWVEVIHGAKVVDVGNFEDVIRTRWDEQKTNISTVLIKREVED